MSQFRYLLLALCSWCVSASGQSVCGDAAFSNNLGGGSAGAVGVPILTSGGSPTPGSPFSIRVTGLGPGAQIVLAASSTGAPVPLPGFGVTLFPLPPYGVLTAAQADGAGCARVDILPGGVVDLGLCGVEVFLQAVALDSQAQGGWPSVRPSTSGSEMERATWLDFF